MLWKAGDGVYDAYSPDIRDSDFQRLGTQLLRADKVIVGSFRQIDHK